MTHTINHNNTIEFFRMDLPKHLGGNFVEVMLYNGIIKEITFYDDNLEILIIIDNYFHLMNPATLVYIKTKVYAIN